MDSNRNATQIATRLAERLISDDVIKCALKRLEKLLEFKIFAFDRNIFIVCKPMRYREILQGTLQI